MTTPAGSEAQALIFGSGGPQRVGGERSSHTSSEEPPPMSNRMTLSARGSINGVQPVAAKVTVPINPGAPVTVIGMFVVAPMNKGTGCVAVVASVNDPIETGI